jgi:hypothetical protein
MIFSIEVEEEIPALALRALAEKMENGEAVAELLSVSFQAA